MQGGCCGHSGSGGGSAAQSGGGTMGGTPPHHWRRGLAHRRLLPHWCAAISHDTPDDVRNVQPAQASQTCSIFGHSAAHHPGQQSLLIMAHTPLGDCSCIAKFYFPLRCMSDLWLNLEWHQGKSSSIGRCLARRPRKRGGPHRSLPRGAAPLRKPRHPVPFHPFLRSTHHTISEQPGGP